MENLTKFDDFKNKKHGSRLNEGVIKIGNEYVVSDIQVPVSLVNSYIKKIKDETGKNVRDFMSDYDVAFRLVNYSIENHLQIDNLPASVVMGDAAPESIEVTDTPAQQNAQPQAQAQDVQAQPKEETQTDKTAQEVPATETGTAQTPPVQTAQKPVPAPAQGGQSQEI